MLEYNESARKGEKLNITVIRLKLRVNNPILTADRINVDIKYIPIYIVTLHGEQTALSPNISFTSRLKELSPSCIT